MHAFNLILWTETDNSEEFVNILGLQSQLWDYMGQPSPWWEISLWVETGRKTWEYNK